MSRPVARVLAVAVLAWLCQGGTCAGGGGSGGSRSVIDISDSDDSPGLRIPCTTLPGKFPAGLDFVPGQRDRLVVANFAPAALVPFDAAASPPVVASPGAVPSLPSDSNGDGVPEGGGGLALGPALDGVLGVRPGLAFLTATNFEEVIFADADTGRLVSFEVQTPASFDPRDHLFLPPPGTAAVRTAVSAIACVPVPPGALDSRGDPVRENAPICGAGRGRFPTTFTSGVALAGGRLFVSSSNLGADAGTENTQYFPGTVLVFEIDLAVDPPSVSPDAATRVLYTTAFNPTELTTVTTPGGRELVLVTVSGALGLREDDPDTPALEGGGLTLGDAAVDVIDPLEVRVVATVPLGPASLGFDRPAIDAQGRVAVFGSAVGRRLLAIDLLALDALPALAPGEPPVQLDGSDARALDAAGNPADARIFDGSAPFEFDALPGSPPEEICNGFTVGVGFDAASERLFATEFCDGGIAVVDVDLANPPDVPPLPRERFALLRTVAVTGPLGPEALGQSRAPGALRVRAGTPGMDFEGPDLFFLVGLPEGKLCAVESARL